nr:hypothetical protein [Bacteroidota bacterium]
MKGPFFPNAVLDDRIEYTAADSSLWFFWAMQKYAQHTAKPIEVWKDYGKVMKTILESYRDGTWYNIKMNDDGLLFAGESGMAVTWMNAMVDGKPVTPRIGFPVELNALWYNAIMFSLELARKAKDSSFISKWKNIPGAICKSFEQIFWDEKKGYLADYVNGNYKDWAVRPNQLFAASLPYSPIKEVQQMSVMRIIESELLTSRGLRTLAPKNIKYRGFYRGNQKERDEAYHNGSVFPWLFGQFAEAYLQLYGKEGLLVIKNLYRNFEPAMQTEGIGTISELYDGDPPHHPGGAISQAWAVAELLRVGKMISGLEK